MDRERLGDALDSMTSRDLERLQEEIARRLVKCVVCGGDGAVPVQAVVKRGVSAGRSGTRATLMVCPPCFSKHRLPEGRSRADDDEAP